MAPTDPKRCNLCGSEKVSVGTTKKKETPVYICKRCDGDQKYIPKLRETNG